MRQRAAAAAKCATPIARRGIRASSLVLSAAQESPAAITARSSSVSIASVSIASAASRARLATPTRARWHERVANLRRRMQRQRRRRLAQRRRASKRPVGTPRVLDDSVQRDERRRRHVGVLVEDSIEVNVREASSAASDARASAPPVPPRSIASTTAASKAAAASSRATAFPFATAATARCPASLIRALSATSAREPARRGAPRSPPPIRRRLCHRARIDVPRPPARRRWR